MDDAFVGKTIQERFDVIQQRCSLRGIARRAKILDHRPHFAAVDAIAFATAAVLADTLFSRLVLWHGKTGVDYGLSTDSLQ